MTDNPPARHRRNWARFALAGPLAIIATLVVLAGLPLWLPRGAAGIDNIVVPLVLAPLIWAGLFFHACLDRNLLRVGAVTALLVAVHGGLVAERLLAGPILSEATR